jgi:hypothetical protein
MGVRSLPLYGLLFAGGFLAFLLIRMANRRSETSFLRSLIPRELPPQPDGSVSAEVRAYLLQRTSIVAGLLLRAASELRVANSAKGASPKAGVRGMVNELMRTNGFWHQLEPEEADLFRVPDGCWTSAQTRQLPTWCEQLRLLRWTVGMDAEIDPLAHIPKPAARLFRTALGDEQPFERPNVLEAWQLRQERDAAAGYALRIFCELVHRGSVDPDLGRGVPKGMSYERRGPADDYLAGVRTVGELDDRTLNILACSAVARFQYARYLMDQLRAQQPISYSRWLADQERNKASE